MPNKVTKKFKIANAKSFKESFGPDLGNYLYLFFARPNPWLSGSDPTTPTDSQLDEATLWDEIISLKKINYADISLVVRRVNWTAQTVYNEYDDQDPDLLSKDFYVLNSELNVYKCIDNFNSSPSIIEPTGKRLEIFRTADGYKWKYLYSIPVSDRLKFLTNNWMPVFVDSEVAAAAKDGAIENIKIFNGGLDYSLLANVTIQGDGSGANIVARQSLGVIYDFIYNNVGSGYRFANAYVTDPYSSLGRGANIRAIMSPVGGHGKDPNYELGAKYVMINARADYNEGFGDFPGTFTYRKLGLIKNPKTYNNVVANVSTMISLGGLQLSNINGTFTISEYVEGLTTGANTFAVVGNINGTSGTLRYMQTNYLTSNFKEFTVGEIVVGKKSGATGIVANIFLPETAQDTGDILYIENRDPITRSANQTDNLHLVIEF